MTKQSSNPEESIAVSDPGDDIARRFRFQWTWAAVMSCSILDSTNDVQEVFCEHHEDILVKHLAGNFTGLQVKTRSADQPPWKARDEQVVKSVARFARLESDFPGHFKKFSFLTNHQIYKSDNGQDLLWILDCIRGASSASDLDARVNAWLKKVADTGKVTLATAFAAASKTNASGELPKLDDVTLRLVNTLAESWEPAESCSHSALRSSALSLVEECGRASSLDHKQSLPGYFGVIAEPDQAAETCIDAKRMTAHRVKQSLESGLVTQAELDGDPAKGVKPGEGSTDLLRAKLDAAGFSAVSMNSAEDLRDKADYLGLKWAMQHGNEKGLGQYNHIQSLVLSDASRAFDATQAAIDPFGPKMREDLRQRFRDRRKDGAQLYDATDDHLEGFVFSLTSQCKVVWSHARPWEEQE